MITSFILSLTYQLWNYLTNYHTTTYLITCTGIRLANASTIALDFSDMLGALQTLYLVTVPSNDNNDHFPFFDGFIIEGAFDHELCVQLLQTGNPKTVSVHVFI